MMNSDSFTQEMFYVSNILGYTKSFYIQFVDSDLKVNTEISP